MLVRHYINKKLKQYYSQPHDKVVGSFKERNINFQSLWGEYHWKSIYHKLYKEQKGQWLTPIELFKPYYSQIIGNYIINEALQVQSSSSSKTIESNNNNHNNNNKNTKNDNRIHIIELGGGRGTNAYCILSHIKNKQPLLYEQIYKYTIIDSSPTLHTLQKQTLLLKNNECIENKNEEKLEISDHQENKEDDHSNKIELLLQDLTDIAEDKKKVPKFLKQCFQQQQQQQQQNKEQHEDNYSDTTTHTAQTTTTTHTFVLAMEMFDNLGHDKVRRTKSTRNIEQAEVNDKTQQEVFVPLKDELLSNIIKILPFYSGKIGQPMWVPTISCGILQKFIESTFDSANNKSNNNNNDKLHILVADFDWLPSPDISIDSSSSTNNGNDRPPTNSSTSTLSTYAVGEPLITSMNDIDYECYIQSPKYCDILFPTNFLYLKQFIENLIIKLRQSSKGEKGSFKRQKRKTGRRRRRRDHDIDDDNKQKQTTGVRVMKQSQFLQLYGGGEEIEQTKSWLTGYTPLLHDFGNVSVLIYKGQ